ncbi:hypothetical protein BDFB_007908, partial [Asbolus verrucosus]
VHPKSGIDITTSVERYDALPGLETVRSMISINASLELFKNGIFFTSGTEKVFIPNILMMS